MIHDDMKPFSKDVGKRPVLLFGGVAATGRELSATSLGIEYADRVQRLRITSERRVEMIISNHQCRNVLSFLLWVEISNRLLLPLAIRLEERR